MPQKASVTPALERPRKLKKWSSDLIRIVKDEVSDLFNGWDFQGSLTKADYGRILDKMQSCGSVVELRASLDKISGEVGQPVIHAANYCGQHTICPYCAGRVQDRRGAKFHEPIREMARKYGYAYMVTATIPPVETWREDLNLLIEGWQSFRRMGQTRNGRASGKSQGEWGKVKAALAKVELKRGAGSGLPHCHYHALVFTDIPFDYRIWSQEEKEKPKEERNPLYKIPSMTDPRGWVPGSKISWEWYQATGGRAINIRIDPLKYLAEHKKKGKSYEDSIFEQSQEVLKYATKFDSCPEKGAEALFARDFVGIRDATYNRRLFVSYGAFRQVGGSDFNGGGPHISEAPIIYESRWHGVDYSPLKERSTPIFPNTDISPRVSERLQTLNRVQGQIRRMRSAILASRNHYHETGELRPAFYARREYLPEGGFKEWPSALEVPLNVIASPRDLATWEAWVNEAMQKGRTFYQNTRETLMLAGMDHLDGTLEEREETRRAMVEAWGRSDAYADDVVELFRETLITSRQALEAPS